MLKSMNNKRTPKSNFLIFNSKPPCGSALYSEIAPKIIPVTVAMIMTKLTWTTDFLIPSSLKSEPND